MSGGLFEYPQKTAFGRVLPKTKVYTFGKASRRLRDRFASDINQIIWRFKLAPETINIPTGPTVTEIQIFGVELKPGIKDLQDDVLRCIDNAIAFPIFFEIATTAARTAKTKVMAAFKRPSEADSSKWVVGDYFAGDWMPIDAPRTPLPVAVTLSGLYEQMLRQLMPVAPRPGEPLQDLVDRHRQLATKRRELQKLAAQLKRERQFSRKVELNALLRAARAQVDVLANGQALEGHA
jgi:hypothetical protein